MSGLNIQNSRIQQKFSTVSGATPTLAPSTDHTDGTWSETDLYIGEIFFNVNDDKAWFRSLNGIIPITSGASYISTYVNKTGDTMTGALYVPSLSAVTLSGGSIYSNDFHGRYYGDGSNLTGITATVFTGGTISGPTIFLNDVDLTSASLSASSITGYGNLLEVFSDLNVIGNLSATTFYGDGSGLTNLPYLSGLTLDNVLSEGDTSTDGNIVLTNGSITLTNGTFIGDGSGLTNIPGATTPTLDDVLQEGNTSTDYDINLTNGNIVLGNGSFVGDGSLLTNLPVSAFTSNLESVLTSGNHAGNNNIFIPNLYGIFNDTGVDGSAGLTFDSDGSYLVASTGATYDVGSRSIIGATKSGDASIQVENNVEFNMNLNGIGSGAFTIYGYTGFNGIEYSNDYSANYTNRSLVDKEYIDNSISGFVSAQTLSQTLTTGNITDGNDIIVSNGDRISSADNNFTIDLQQGRYAYEDVNVISRLDIQSDATQLQVLDSVLNRGARVQASLDETSCYAEFSATDGNSGVANYFLVSPSAMTTLSTYSGFEGIKYDNDYSENYTDRSLVDKGYINSITSGFTTGQTLEQTLAIGNSVGVSGLITEDSGRSNLTLGFGEAYIGTILPGENNLLNRVYASDSGCKFESYDDIGNYSKIYANQSSIQLVAYYDSIQTQVDVTPSLFQVNQGDNIHLYANNEFDSAVYGTGEQTNHYSNGTYAKVSYQGGESVNSELNTSITGVSVSQSIGADNTILHISNDNGFYQSQYQTTGISKGASKTNFRSLQTTNATKTSVVWPLSSLEVGTGAVGVKATVTALNTGLDKAYVAELYAAVRMNDYAVTIFGGVDKLEKSEFTLATADIEIESSNVAIRVTGEAATTINWSVKYELIYSV